MATHVPLKKGDKIGNYRIQAKIAEGGCGQTFKGEHLLTGMPVCLKDCSNLEPGQERILLDEAKTMWDLRHFSFPAVRDFIKKDDGSLVMVMSFIPGPTLAQVVEKKGALDAEHVAWITERLLNALMYAHYHGVVHGDVKPHNVIVQPDDHTVVLVDFGLAQVKPKRDSESLGYTPLFAPPEEEAGEPLVPESDLYSLGMTMIYLLGGGEQAVRELEIPKKTPEPMQAFIQRLILRDVLERPHWAKENLFETFRKVRLAAFGRADSGFKALEID